MNNNSCQCAKRSASAQTEFAAAENTSAISHNHRRIPGILKYRGFDDEAKAAARLVRIETLMATLQEALDDLDLTMMDLLTPDVKLQATRQE